MNTSLSKTGDLAFCATATVVMETEARHDAHRDVAGSGLRL
jgi:hypothetical protein